LFLFLINGTKIKTPIKKTTITGQSSAEIAGAREVATHLRKGQYKNAAITKYTVSMRDSCLKFLV